MFKKFCRVIFFIGLVLSLNTHSVLARESTHSATQKAEEIVVVNGDEVINDDYFAAGEEVVIEGEVIGDAAIAGSQVEVSGKVNGDLLTAAGTVIVSGEVKGDARIAGGQVHLSGNFGKNLWIFGGEVTISEETEIKGSLLIFGGIVTIKGRIDRNVTVYGSQITFNGNVEQNITLRGDIIQIGEQAEIKGNLKSSYQASSTISDQAMIEGDKIEEKIQTDSEDWSKDFSPSRIFSVGNILIRFLSFLSLLLIGLILLILFPKSLAMVVKTLEDQPGNSFLTGLLAFPIFVITIIFLILTILGIPLAFILVVLGIIGTYMSRIFIGLWLGQRIFKALNRQIALIWSLMLGMFLFELLTILPFVSLLGQIWGMGAILISLNQLRKAK